MGAGMPLGSLIYTGDLNFIIITSVILFLIGSSRVFLKVHTLAQVLTGAFCGIFISYALLKFCL